jgi:uncharacterized membrane protein YdjX (TVP38/TMEM64 family)
VPAPRRRHPRSSLSAGRRLLLLWLGCAGVLLAVFGVGVAVRSDTWAGPERWLHGRSAPAAMLSVTLLALDAVLPVPSSLVMLANGAAFGPVGGAAVSCAGGVASLGVASWCGRRCRRGARRLVGDESPAASRLLARYGSVAVLATRPVPLLAESVAIAAAAGGMPTSRLVLAGTAGVVPVSILYAWAGAQGDRPPAALLAGGLMAAALLLAAAKVLRAMLTSRLRRDVPQM